jgi:hypothetical protein
MFYPQCTPMHPDAPLSYNATPPLLIYKRINFFLGKNFVFFFSITVRFAKALKKCVGHAHAI